MRSSSNITRRRRRKEKDRVIIAILGDNTDLSSFLRAYNMIDEKYAFIVKLPI